jgi:hypothetical protein
MMNPVHTVILNHLMLYLLLFTALTFAACSSPKQQMQKRHLKGEYIFRLHHEFFFTPPSPIRTFRDPYPWENRYIAGLPRITKEFFRCKGNALNKPIILAREGKEPIKYFDCHGKHGLPLREGTEYIYPCLIDILNFVQKHSAKQVVITCGHRCPKHNVYSDRAPANLGSKHMLGAEVDFYVAGLEQDPQSIITIIQQYYSETYPGKKGLTHFQRYEKTGLNVSTPPLYNDEIFIKLYLEHEGRDLDNQHPYPYLCLQVRMDRERNTKVSFDARQSENFLRY